MTPQSQPATATIRKRKKPQKSSKTLAEEPTNPVPVKTKKAHKQKKQEQTNAAAAAAAAADESAGSSVPLSAALPPARQLGFLLRSFERAAKMRLSPLELGAYSEECMVQLPEGASQDVDSFGDHVKGVFGASWKEELCEGKLVEGSVDAGSPALLVISLGALRSLELMRGLKMFTRGCRAVKLFAKHMKMEEQAASLKARVNVACGTPSRIKKLIDMEALSLSRLKLVVLDMQGDPKSFNLFTLPQVSNEFWDLYKGYLDQKVREGDTRICFYGAVSGKDANKLLPSGE